MERAELDLPPWCSEDEAIVNAVFDYFTKGKIVTRVEINHSHFTNLVKLAGPSVLKRHHIMDGKFGLLYTGPGAPYLVVANKDVPEYEVRWTFKE